MINYSFWYTNQCINHPKFLIYCYVKGKEPRNLTEFVETRRTRNTTEIRVRAVPGSNIREINSPFSSLNFYSINIRFKDTKLLSHNYIPFHLLFTLKTLSSKTVYAKQIKYSGAVWNVDDQHKKKTVPYFFSYKFIV